MLGFVLKLSNTPEVSSLLVLSMSAHVGYIQWLWTICWQCFGSGWRHTARIWHHLFHYWLWVIPAQLARNVNYIHRKYFYEYSCWVCVTKNNYTPLTGTPQTGQVDFHIYASGADGGDIFICKSPNREFEPEYILTVQVTNLMQQTPGVATVVMSLQ